MDSLRQLLEDYDRLGAAEFSSPQDFMLRQRHLESWAERARAAIADLVRADGLAPEPQQALTGRPPIGRTGS